MAARRHQQRRQLGGSTVSAVAAARWAEQRAERWQVAAAAWRWQRSISIGVGMAAAAAPQRQRGGSAAAARRQCGSSAAAARREKVEMMEEGGDAEPQNLSAKSTLM